MNVLKDRTVTSFLIGLCLIFLIGEYIPRSKDPITMAKVNERVYWTRKVHAEILVFGLVFFSQSRYLVKPASSLSSCPFD